MTDSYRMSDMCAMCGERYGQHVGLSCCNSRGSFFLAAKPANGPESYHYRASLDDYFTRAANQANRLVFPSGAAVLTSGDKIVGRVEAASTADRLQGAMDSLAKKCEPKRAPLDWNTTTSHDTFGPDFIVTKGAVEVTPTPSPTTQGAYPAIAGLLRG